VITVEKGMMTTQPFAIFVVLQIGGVGDGRLLALLPRQSVQVPTREKGTCGEMFALWRIHSVEAFP